MYTYITSPKKVTLRTVLSELDESLMVLNCAPATDAVSGLPYVTALS